MQSEILDVLMFPSLAITFVKIFCPNQYGLRVLECPLNNKKRIWTFDENEVPGPTESECLQSKRLGVNRNGLCCLLPERFCLPRSGIEQKGRLLYEHTFCSRSLSSTDIPSFPPNNGRGHDELNTPPSYQ